MLDRPDPLFLIEGAAVPDFAEPSTEGLQHVLLSYLARLFSFFYVGMGRKRVW